MGEEMLATAEEADGEVQQRICKSDDIDGR